jgi:hypothetical protein
LKLRHRTKPSLKTTKNTMSSRIASFDALPPEAVRRLATPFTVLKAQSMRKSVTTDFQAVNRCTVSSSAVLFAT